MSFCHNCGKEINSTWSSCPYCSAKLKNDKDFTMIFEGKTYGTEILSKGYKLKEKYEIVEKLGQGGMGQVYKVKDLERTKEVFYAVKIIPEESQGSQRILKKLEEETEILEKLNIPEIVRVLDYNKGNKDKGEPDFILMEYIDGMSLEELIEKKEKLKEEEIISIALKISSAMAYAHSKSVIHRDLKPDNIMINKENEIKIMDFGISEVIKNSQTRLTNVKTVGTLTYMSPEQLMGENLGFETDIYSFGIMLYEMANSYPPFNSGGIEYQILNKEAKKLEQISEGFWLVIEKCLRKDYKKRYQNFDEIIKDLNAKKTIDVKKEEKFKEKLNKQNNFIKNYILPKLNGKFIDKIEQKEIFRLGIEEGYKKDEIISMIDKSLKIIETKAKESLDSSNKSEFYLKGKEYFYQEEYSKAMEEFKKAAKEENPKALYKLGKMYYMGIACIKNTKKAYSYFLMAANKGSAKACYVLGEINEKNSSLISEVMGKKENEIRKWYLRAANLNYVPAFFKMLEIDYNNSYYDFAYNWMLKLTKLGRQIESKEISTFLEIYEKAIKGKLYYINLLGEILLEKGEKDKAETWFKKASMKGSYEARKNLGDIYLEKYRNTDDLNDVKLSFNWYKLAAEENHAPALYMLGYMYENALGVSLDLKASLKAYQASSSKDNDEAQLALARFYYNGKGLIQNYYKAFELYQKLAKKDNNFAILELGKMFSSGYGTSKSIEKAKERFLKVYKSETAKIEEKKEAKKLLDSLKKGCFITEASYEALGKNDKIYELELFRKFRDNWLLKENRGRILIEEYYELAPKITEKINNLSNSKELYDKIWKDYLLTCKNLLELQNYDKCMEIYVKMVRVLSSKYL